VSADEIATLEWKEVVRSELGSAHDGDRDELFFAQGCSPPTAGAGRKEIRFILRHTGSARRMSRTTANHTR
jgi:hypothetical protein